MDNEPAARSPVDAVINGREFEALAAHAGRAYLRYSFTKGTEQEVGFLIEVMGLQPGMILLDVGCGPGRHLEAFARRGFDVVGLDISRAFLQIAAGPHVRGDARRLPFSDCSFDGAYTLCQGGFGLLGGTDDLLVAAELGRVVKPGAPVALSAFSSYFAVRYLEEGETFDVDAGVLHESTDVRDESGRPARFDLWTTCFTPRELRLMAERAGLATRAVWSVGPGEYAARPPDNDHPEFFALLTAPSGSVPGPV